MVAVDAAVQQRRRPYPMVKEWRRPGDGRRGGGGDDGIRRRVTATALGSGGRTTTACYGLVRPSPARIRRQHPSLAAASGDGNGLRQRWAAREQNPSSCRRRPPSLLSSTFPSSKRVSRRTRRRVGLSVAGPSSLPSRAGGRGTGGDGAGTSSGSGAAVIRSLLPARCCCCCCFPVFLLWFGSSVEHADATDSTIDVAGSGF
uniref:Uncharacterized protein n=1 Tax=Oryza nivara TaxID=4536 RepID=A0A0E0J1L5_ORYNI